MVPTADRQKATVLVRIAFDTLDPRLLPDMGVKVAFLGSDSPAASAAAPSASPTLPKAVVRTDQGSTVVFVMKDEGHVERRAVRTGRTKDDSIEIVSGVTAGDRVVTTAAAPLVDGAQVVVK